MRSYEYLTWNNLWDGRGANHSFSKLCGSLCHSKIKKD